MATSCILLESGSSHEGRSVLHAAMLEDIPVSRVKVHGLADHAQALRSAAAIPVGSVEYMRQAMMVAGVVEPRPLSYPAPLLAFLGRQVERSRAGLLGGRCFVKPVQTKRFTGFVFDSALPPSGYSEHDREQLAALQALPASEPVWRCEIVQFVCEWRYYVLDGAILGCGRYDPEGADDAQQPDGNVVRQAVHSMRQSGISAYALDMGVLDNGQTVLVEANDAWALGLYGRAVEPSTYWGMLRRRWQQMHESSHQRVYPLEEGSPHVTV